MLIAENIHDRDFQTLWQVHQVEWLTTRRTTTVTTRESELETVRESDILLSDGSMMIL
jgi:hypothetical protein